MHRKTVLIALVFVAIFPLACEEGPSPTQPVGVDGLTAVHRAAEAGDVETLEYLLFEEQADPNVLDANGVAPIHRAARDGDLETVIVLVQYGAITTRETPTGWTPIQLAIREGHVETVHFLSQYGFDPNGILPSGESYVAYAGRTNDFALLDYLVKTGADLNGRLGDGSTLLEAAIRNDHVEFAVYLLDHGVSLPNDKRRIGPMLHHAFDIESESLVHALLRAGAPPDATTPDGKTPYQRATDLEWYVLAELIDTLLADAKRNNSP